MSSKKVTFMAKLQYNIETIESISHHMILIMFDARIFPLWQDQNLLQKLFGLLGARNQTFYEPFPS
jgi:hypothetical protein